VAVSPIRSLLCAAGLAFFCCSAEAALTVQVLPGSTYSVPQVVDFSPNGFDMSGLRVTATFSDNLSETEFWSATDAVSGHAVGLSHGGWSLSETGDTFYNSGVWHLQYSGSQARLTSLLIEGGSFGNTLFDLQGLGRTTAGSVTPGNADATAGTDGSQRGRTFDPLNQDIFPNLDVTATYSNLVKLDAASSPIGDLWTSLQIDFGPQPGGGLLGDPAGAVDFEFFADTDIWGAPTNAVPEPSSLALFAGLGLLGACWRRRSKLTRTSAPS
jgi:hypothetical protein